MNWLTININPPKLDVAIVARTANEFGYGPKVEVFEFDSDIHSEDDAIAHLENHSFIEWLELPK